MLQVDLGHLARQHRWRIDAEVPVDDPLWEPLPFRFAEPVVLCLDVQQAGADVVVRGTVEGVADREIDLTDAVREHVLLAVPGFVECSESCRGLCPRCGVNRNDVSCDCAENAGDDRWAALRDLKSD
jgi:hypothetical protein